MSHPKEASTRKRNRKAAPALGAAGLSLSLLSGMSAASGAPAPDLLTWNAATNHEITLGEEEISDVSLGTFCAFDSENVQTDRPAGRRFAVGCGGCGCGHGP